MGNRTPNLQIPIPYPRSANVDELFNWERFLHDAFIVVDTAIADINRDIGTINAFFQNFLNDITTLGDAIREIREGDILLASRIRIAGRRPLSALLSELGDEGGGLLYFPAGTYAVSSTLTVPANVRLLGNNAVLRPSSSFYNSGDAPMFSVAGHGVVFEGLVFEGHPTNNDVRVSAIATNGNETTIVRCRFVRTGYCAVDHRSTTKDGVLRIRDSRFEDCWGDCILTNLSINADSVLFTHPSTSISTVAAYRGYGVGIKASTQAGRTLRMALQSVEFDRLLRTAIVLTANPSHPAYEVRINKVKVRQVGLTRFSNPSGEASAIGNDESLYGALIYVQSTATNESDVGTVHITDFDVDEPYGFVVRFPANNSNRHYLNKGRYKHGASGWSGSNPFSPISLRLARAFVSDVEGNAFRRHFTKQSDAYGTYDTVFQNCRFSGAGDFGGTATDDIWYINCTFSGSAPAPKGRWFIGCRGASQYQGDKVIACEGGHIASSSLHIGDAQTGMCFKTTASYGLIPQIKANGRLRTASVFERIFIPSTAFLLAEAQGGSSTLSPSFRLHPTADGEVVATFNDTNRPSGNNPVRRLITTMAFPPNLYLVVNDDDYLIKLRLYVSSTQGQLHIVPIEIRIRVWFPTETAQRTLVLRPFNPLFTQSNPANRVRLFELTIQPQIEGSGLLDYSLVDGSLTIEIARSFAANENDTVMLHGAELMYSALF